MSTIPRPTRRTLVRTTAWSAPAVLVMAAAPAHASSTGPAAPTITFLAPSDGATSGGTSVTIGGSGFDPGLTSVTIGGTSIPAAYVTVLSPVALTFLTPAHPEGAVDVTVTTPAGTSAPATFLYTQPS